jgi:hypothetical protein
MRKNPEVLCIPNSSETHYRRVFGAKASLSITVLCAELGHSSPPRRHSRSLLRVDDNRVRFSARAIAQLVIATRVHRVDQEET